MTFTVTEEYFGATKEIDLIPNGSNTYVTVHNRGEYLKKRVEYQFETQCSNQLASFKKGFARMVDIDAFKFLSYRELEEMICGPSIPDFNDLKMITRYGNSFTKDHATIKMFWDLVINDWDDEKRQELLWFATGTKRAPLGGCIKMNPVF